MYPVMLDLTGKKIVVIGGGRIAARKVNGLQGEGAEITVIAKEVAESIKAADVTVIVDAFNHDISMFDLVFIATDDETVNEAVIRQMKPHQLVNDCTNKENSTFYNMASFRTEDARIMISTDGQSPEKSKQLKNKLQSYLADDSIYKETNP